jgi:hypothetical protein
VKPLPLVAPAGCTLSPDGLAEQRGRAEALRSSVLGVESSVEGFRVRFEAGVESAVAELVARERECCSFLDLGWDEGARVLSVGSSDREAVAAFETFFRGGVRV